MNKINKQDVIECWYDDKRDLQVKAYEAKFYMDNVEVPLRFIKFQKKIVDE